MSSTLGAGATAANRLKRFCALLFGVLGIVALGLACFYLFDPKATPVAPSSPLPNVPPHDGESFPRRVPFIDLEGRPTFDGYIPTKGPSLSIDCQYLAFMDPTQGRGDICLLKLSDRTVERVVESPNVERDPRFSDRNTLLFLRESGAFRHVYALNLNDKQITQVTDGDFVDDILDISPDGDRLLISRKAIREGWETDPWPLVEEWKLKAGTRTGFQARRGALYASNGKAIVYNGDDDALSLWILDRTAQKPRRIGKGMAIQSHPALDKVLVWIPPKQWSDRGDVSIVDTHTGQTRQLDQASGAQFASNDHLLFTYTESGQTRHILQGPIPSEVREVEIPSGVLAPTVEGPRCGKLPLWIQYPDGDLRYSIALLDIESAKVEEVWTSQVSPVHPAQ